ncbi:hypothetical protein Hanom_Chr01g00077831 [Helianthus anomalus]
MSTTRKKRQSNIGFNNLLSQLSELHFSIKDPAERNVHTFLRLCRIPLLKPSDSWGQPAHILLGFTPFTRKPG